nr:disease resistance protein RPP13-like isoform X6 [Ipomoea batatas]
MSANVIQGTVTWRTGSIEFLKGTLYTNGVILNITAGTNPVVDKINATVDHGKVTIVDRGEMIFYGGKCSSLMVLQLFNFACLGEEWELSETEKFCELIVLDIATADLKHWNASVDHFPKLERLILYWCYNLEELPTDFAEISTLNSIELKQCLPTMVTSAREIEKEQHDYGNDEIVVIEENTILPEESVEGKRKRRLTNKKTPRSKNQST